MKLIARGRSVEPHARWPRQSLTRRTAAIQGMAQPCRLIDQLDAARAGGAYPRRTSLDQLGDSRAGEAYQGPPKTDASYTVAVRGIGKLHCGGCPEGR